MYSALAQFGLFSLITWTFILLAGQTLETAWPLSLTLGVAGLQLTGVGLFCPLLYALARKKLDGHGLLLESLYTLRSLSTAGLPSQQVLKEARLDELTQLKAPSLKPLRERVLELARLYQKQGAPLARETQLLLQDAWFMREESMSQLIKMTEQLKLIFLILFFGGAYALFILGLLHHLLSSGGSH